MSGPQRWSDVPAGDAANVPHLWLCDIDRLACESGRALAVLDDDERGRWRRLVFERDRGRFLASHLFLRAVLARYAGCEPGALRFLKGEHGKPALDPRCAGTAVPAFNLSHSGSRALLAVVPGARSVGADIEQHRPGRRLQALAERNFARPEAALLARTPSARQDALFYRIWTLKEAYIKARATGLSLPLDGFEFRFATNGELELDARAAVDAQPQRWHCLSWELAEGYGAALVHDAPRAALPRWFEARPLVDWCEREVAVGFRTRG